MIRVFWNDFVKFMVCFDMVGRNIFLYLYMLMFLRSTLWCATKKCMQIFSFK